MVVHMIHMDNLHAGDILTGDLSALVAPPSTPA